MLEKTVIKTLALPHGREWLWYPQANVLALSDRLDACGRARAVDEAQAYWRTRLIKVELAVAAA